MVEPLLRSVSISLLPHRRPLSGHRTTLVLLCRVDNVADVEEERRPLQLVVALDRSGSMGGSKLENALATLRSLIDELGPEDRLGLIAFDDIIDVVLRPTLMNSSSKDLARSALRRFNARGGTDLCAATLQAFSLAAEMGPGSHVIVLTDGAPTSGVSDPNQIIRVIGGAIEKLTMSTFGYGKDVQPELLGQMADVGRSNYHFIDGNEPPLDAFASELGGQRAIVGLDVKLKLIPAKGVKIRSWPLAAQGVVHGDGSASLSLTPLTNGDSIPLVITLELLENLASIPLTSPILEAKLSCRDATAGKLVENSAIFTPVLANTDGPYLNEVVREMVIERCAEAIHNAARHSLAELTDLGRNLEDLVVRAQLGSDQQVVAAIGLLAQVRSGLKNAASREHTVSDISAISRGISKRRATMSGSTMAAFDDERSRLYRTKLGGEDPDGSKGKD